MFISTFLARGLTPWMYIMVVGTMVHICNMLLSFLLAMLGISLAHLGGIQDSTHDLRVILALSVTLLPLIETIIGQLLPIITARKVFHDDRIAVIVSMIVFAGLHALNSPWYVVITIPAAYLLAATYIVYGNSVWRALLITACCHAVANGWATVWIVLDRFMV